MATVLHSRRRDTLIKTLFSIVVAVAVLSAFAFLNADGQPTYLLRFPLKSQNPNLPSFDGFKLPQKRVFNTGEGNWMHGWPFAGLLRLGVYPLGHKGETAQRHFSGPLGSYSRWPFDDSPWDHTNIYAFIFNVIIAIVAAYGASVYAFKLATNEFRLSILLLLELTLVAAVLVTFRRYILDTFDMTEAISLIVAFGAITITLAHALGIVTGSWYRLCRTKG